MTAYSGFRFYSSVCVSIQVFGEEVSPATHTSIIFFYRKIVSQDKSGIVLQQK